MTSDSLSSYVAVILNGFPGQHNIGLMKTDAFLKRFSMHGILLNKGCFFVSVDNGVYRAICSTTMLFPDVQKCPGNYFECTLSEISSVEKRRPVNIEGSIIVHRHMNITAED
jgi:hypothetical protein